MNTLLFALFIGIGATALMDMWGLARKPLLGVASPNYRLVGRWIAHMTHGQFRHDAISQSVPVRGETLIGWLAHYLIGIGFAVVLVAIWGTDWLKNPTLAPALIIGIGTVIAPLFIMQPGMGAGIAASRTPNPNSARLHSLIMHSVFGLGLYLTALALAPFFSSLLP